MLLDLAPLQKAGITSGPFVAANGAFCLPIEHKLPTGNNATALVISYDDGRTFGPPITVDSTGQRNLCDTRFDVLPNGRIIALLWTFLQESEVTIAAHCAFSDDHGLTWSTPVDTGCAGQITAPLALPDGRVLAVSNYRHEPMGSLLWHSADGGETWLVDQPIQMWDAAARTMAGCPVTIHPPDSV